MWHSRIVPLLIIWGLLNTYFLVTGAINLSIYDGFLATCCMIVDPSVDRRMVGEESGLRRLLWSLFSLGVLGVAISYNLPTPDVPVLFPVVNMGFIGFMSGLRLCAYSRWE